MEIIVILLVVAVIWLALQSRRTSQQLGTGRSARAVSAADLEAARRTAQEDVTRFGEELQRLDADVHMGSTDEAMLQDWQRALDSY
jgi:hypothetical protein